jgi:hypothetical protein
LIQQLLAHGCDADGVPDNKVDFNAGFLGASTALAQTTLGQRVAGRVPYRAAHIVEVRVLSVAIPLSSLSV